MADGIENWVGRAFAAIHPKNPLRRMLSDSDQKVLWALLMVYSFSSKRRRKGGAANDPLEKISRVLADSAKLGAELKSEVFGGPFSQALRPFTAGFEDIPPRLIGFSERLASALDLFGKSGHKAKNLATQSLIEASEFVRLKTGENYDVHLAELLQATGNRSLEEELSAEAIGKKRKYLEKHFPALYLASLNRARNFCGIPASQDGLEPEDKPKSRSRKKHKGRI